MRVFCRCNVVNALQTFLEVYVPVRTGYHNNLFCRMHSIVELRLFVMAAEVGIKFLSWCHVFRACVFLL